MGFLFADFWELLRFSALDVIPACPESVLDSVFKTNDDSRQAGMIS
jgi:hypothetical protein